MDPASIVEDTERARFCTQTDKRMDEQGETSVPPSTLLSRGYNKPIKSEQCWVGISCIDIQLLFKSQCPNLNYHLGYI